MATEQQASVLSMPCWGMDRASYERTCRYLGLTPNAVLHAKLSHYLLQVAATRPAPEGFGRWLAELEPGRATLGFLDVWTRLILPGHPWRYRLNGIIAVHECDALGYREMMAAPDSKSLAWAEIASGLAAFGSKLLIGGLWLTGQACLCLVAGCGLRTERRRFGNATVLVTGASRGLGLALTERLLSLGAQVVAVARESPALSALRLSAAEAGLRGRLIVVAADVTEANALGPALAASGVDPQRIDVAIVNAGVKEEASAMNRMALEKTFAVNVFGAAHTVGALIDDWRARGHGQFVFISSLGRWHGMNGTGAYNASKAALSMLAESMALDLKTDGEIAIDITIVEPGLIRTHMIAAGGLQDRLAVDVRTAAKRTLQCAARRKCVCRFPRLFTLMTVVIAALPMRLRIHLLSRLRAAK